MAGVAALWPGPLSVTSSTVAPVRSPRRTATRSISKRALGLALSSTPIRRPDSTGGDAARRYRGRPIVPSGA